MQYSYVYIDGAYSIRNERGEYACFPTASGPKRRTWPSSAMAERWITDPARYPSHGRNVWGLSDAVVQAKPGQTSMRHRTSVPSNGYKPAHGGYPGEVVGHRKVVPLSEVMEAFYQELKATAVGSPDPFGLYTAHQGTTTGRMSSSKPAFQEVKRRAAPNVVHKFVDGNEEASTIPDALTGNLQEPMSLGEMLRFILRA